MRTLWTAMCMASVALIGCGDSVQTIQEDTVLLTLNESTTGLPLTHIGYDRETDSWGAGGWHDGTYVRVSSVSPLSQPQVAGIPVDIDELLGEGEPTEGGGGSIGFSAGTASSPGFQAGVSDAPGFSSGLASGPGFRTGLVSAPGGLSSLFEFTPAPATGASCDLSALCNVAFLLCEETVGALQDIPGIEDIPSCSGQRSACEASVNAIFVPAELESAVCAVADFYNCLGSNITDTVAIASCSEQFLSNSSIQAL